MTLPAINVNKDLVLHSSTPEAPTGEPGWDPFEVWRTRVLLPRLAESGEKAGGTSAPQAAVKLVRS